MRKRVKSQFIQLVRVQRVVPQVPQKPAIKRVDAYGACRVEIWRGDTQFRFQLPVLTRCSFAPIPSPIPRRHRTLFVLLASRPAFGLRLNLTDSASTLPFSRLAQCSFSLWSSCSLMRPCRTFCVEGFVFCRCQQPTLRLLPAGATAAGWVIFLPLDQRPFPRRTSFAG